MFHALKTLLPSFALLLVIPLIPAYGQIRTMDINFASTAPTIDGVISAGEWDAAASGGGAWRNIRTASPGTLDTENNRFRALWDSSGFYLLGESDYGFWGADFNGQNPASSDFVGDFFNVFMDPNTLDEANGQLDEEIDNYQIGFNVYPDARSCGGDGVSGTADDCTQEPAEGGPLPPDGVNVTGSTFGTLTAAHVDGLFNNDSEWEHLRLTHISYDADANGAVIEMFIPWEEFDALETTNGETPVDTGLHHPFAPSNGDVWFFNVTRQSTDPGNFLPQWNWTSSDFFASHGNGTPGEGHGEITFVGAPEALLGDSNGDGVVNTLDIDPFVLALTDPGQYAIDFPEVDFLGANDINMDGMVSTLDIDSFVALITGSAAATPEPASAGVLLLASLSAVAARRRD